MLAMMELKTNGTHTKMPPWIKAPTTRPNNTPKTNSRAKKTINSDNTSAKKRAIAREEEWRCPSQETSQESEEVNGHENLHVGICSVGF